MKKLIVLTMMLLCGMTSVFAQKPAEMKFEKASHDFGTFTENEAVQSCTFTFQNVGESPLIINQAMASCGCTDPEYPKTPIQPGEKGQVKVTYNGVGKSFGHFRKFVTFMTNGNPEKVKIYIEGDMEEAAKQ
jgi:hypothetical protein